MSPLILTLGVVLLATVGMIFAVWRTAVYLSTASDEHDTDGDDASVQEMNIQTQYAEVFIELPHTPHHNGTGPR